MTSFPSDLRPRTLRCFATALILGLAVTAASCATPESESKSASQGIGLPSMLEEIRRHPENRAAGEAYCRMVIDQSSNDFPFGTFIAGLFAVPEEDGDKAFCTALVESVIAGELTESDLAHFSNRNRNKEPLGTLLRKLMAAQLRLSGMTTVRHAVGTTRTQL